MSRGTIVETGRGLSQPVRCLVVDASARVVGQIHSTLSFLTPGIRLLSPARGGPEALRAIRDLRPDLLFLDLDMPRMAGLTTLRALGGLRPARVVVLAPETLEGGRAAWDALGLGAYDFLPKRERRGEAMIDLPPDELAAALFRAIAPFAGLRREGALRLRTRATWAGETASLPVLLAMIGTHRLTRLARFMSWREDPSPPLVIEAPHPPRFTKALLEGLNRAIRRPVRVAAPGDRLAPDQIFLVSGGERLLVRRDGFGCEIGILGPAPGPESGARSLGMGNDLAARLGDQGGLLLADRPPRTMEHVARRLSREGRLFLLKAPGPDGGRLPLLRTVCPASRPAALRNAS